MLADLEVEAAEAARAARRFGGAGDDVSEWSETPAIKSGARPPLPDWERIRSLALRSGA